MDIDTEAQMSEALADPAAFTVTITGRNGFTVTHNFPLYDYEKGEISHSIDSRRHELWSETSRYPVGWESLPYERVITYTLKTSIR